MVARKSARSTLLIRLPLESELRKPSPIRIIPPITSLAVGLALGIASNIIKRMAAGFCWKAFTARAPSRNALASFGNEAAVISSTAAVNLRPCTDEGSTMSNRVHSAIPSPIR